MIEGYILVVTSQVIFCIHFRCVLFLSRNVELANSPQVSQYLTLRFITDQKTSLGNAKNSGGACRWWSYNLGCAGVVSGWTSVQ